MTREEQVVRALLARSDVEAAAYALHQHDGETWARGLLEYAKHYWPAFFGTEADYHMIYSVAGAHEVENGGSHETLNGDSRFTAVLQSALTWGELDGPLLDFGCSRGFYSVALHNACGFDVIGYDIDVKSIEAAGDHARKHAREAGRLRFAVGTHTQLLEDAPACGAALVAEVLEHVHDYRAVIDAVERLLPDGAPICVTTPYGPLEYNSWLLSPMKPREHVREFTHEDLREVFGSKRELQIQRLSIARHPILGDEGGVHVLTYRRDERCVTGMRDLARAVAQCDPKPAALPF